VYSQGGNFFILFHCKQKQTKNIAGAESMVSAAEKEKKPTERHTAKEENKKKEQTTANRNKFMKQMQERQDGSRCQRKDKNLK
jgi:hypothetical protein